MDINKGFMNQTHTALYKHPNARSEDTVDEANEMRRRYSGSTRHKIIMIASTKGQTRDIVTGVPPSFKAEARAGWAKRREEAEIERLFR